VQTLRFITTSSDSNPTLTTIEMTTGVPKAVLYYSPVSVWSAVGEFLVVGVFLRLTRLNSSVGNVRISITLVHHTDNVAARRRDMGKTRLIFVLSTLVNLSL
jgi:hypothetical protein